MGELERLPARKVVVSALPLRRNQLEILGRELGTAFRVVDIRDATDDAAFVLAPPCSPQTIGRLRGSFPSAKIIALELQDDGSGLRVDGPVGRTLTGGASAYFVAGSAHAVGDFLRASSAAEEAAESPPALTSPAVDEEVLAQLDALAARREVAQVDRPDAPPHRP